jgi:hypothetical protein
MEGYPGLLRYSIFFLSRTEMACFKLFACRKINTWHVMDGRNNIMV